MDRALAGNCVQLGCFGLLPANLESIRSACASSRKAPVDGLTRLQNVLRPRDSTESSGRPIHPEITTEKLSDQSADFLVKFPFCATFRRVSNSCHTRFSIQRGGGSTITSVLPGWN